MIVVNFSTGKYHTGQKRLEESLYNAGHLNYAMYGDYKQIQSPTHQQSPYEFKIHSMKMAAKEDPIVLWCDASIWLVGDLNRIEAVVKRDGYFMQEAGHYVKDWCNNHTLEYFGLNRDTNYLMFIAGCFAIDFSTEIGQQFMREWEASAKAGCFRGDWNDHRHDMTAGSIIASRLDMKYQRGGEFIAYTGPGYTEPEKDVVFYCQGLV